MKGTSISSSEHVAKIQTPLLTAETQSSTSNNKTTTWKGPITTQTKEYENALKTHLPTSATNVKNSASTASSHDSRAAARQPMMGWALPPFSASTNCEK